jgi:hypothetical protein
VLPKGISREVSLEEAPRKDAKSNKKTVHAESQACGPQRGQVCTAALDGERERERHGAVWLAMAATRERASLGLP